MEDFVCFKNCLYQSFLNRATTGGFKTLISSWLVSRKGCDEFSLLFCFCHVFWDCREMSIWLWDVPYQDYTRVNTVFTNILHKIVFRAYFKRLDKILLKFSLEKLVTFGFSGASTYAKNCTKWCSTYYWEVFLIKDFIWVHFLYSRCIRRKTVSTVKARSELPTIRWPFQNERKNDDKTQLWLPGL